MNTQAIRAYTTTILRARHEYHRDQLVNDGLCENDCGRKKDMRVRTCWTCRREKRARNAA